MRFPMEGGLVRQTQPGGPVTHLPPRLIFHTGPRGVGGGTFQSIHSPPAPLPSSLPGCGLRDGPGSLSFPDWEHMDTLWLPPSLQSENGDCRGEGAG